MSSKKDYDLENSLGMYLDWATQFMRLELNRKFAGAELEATSEQWKILITLWQEDGLTQQQLTEKTFKSKVSLVKLVDGLERRRLVKRCPDPKDRRSNRIYLTQKGTDIQEKLIGLAKENHEQATIGIDQQDLSICLNVLRKIIVNMKGTNVESNK